MKIKNSSAFSTGLFAAMKFCITPSNYPGLKEFTLFIVNSFSPGRFVGVDLEEKDEKKTQFHVLCSKCFTIKNVSPVRKKA